MFKTAEIKTAETNFTFLAWSACDDKYKAYTDINGGKFTKSIFNIWNAYNGDLSYQSAWNVMRYSSEVSKFQRPVMHIIGDYSKFRDIKFLK